MAFVVQNVRKHFGGVPVLDGIDLEVKTGELVSLVGPSGAGKTTLLKLCAGLLSPDSGTIFSESITGNDPILVFQDYLLFPYMNVFENVAFGLKARKTKRGETEKRVEEILGFFGIAEKREAYPATLSGGQRQRVALARALVLKPSLLLLDEPFANLDQNLKMDMAMFLKDTQREFGNITTLCVTHDMEEACAMSDRVGVMLNGRILDYGLPERIYNAPGNVETARFLGRLNRIPSFLFSHLNIDSDSEEVYTLPSAVALDPCEDMDDLHGPGLRGIVKDVGFTGKTYELSLDMEGTSMSVRLVNKPPPRGSHVRVKLFSYLEPSEEGLRRVELESAETEVSTEEEIV